MKTYHKIQTIFKRDPKTHKIIEGDFTMPEFEYLRNNYWRWFEKVDGTNIRIMPDEYRVEFGGKTDKAQLPVQLRDNLRDMFPFDKMLDVFSIGPTTQVCLYGEGYGKGIQKGGKYCDEQTFVLFDIWIDGWWLRKEAVKNIANSLGIDMVPELEQMTLQQAIEVVRYGYDSKWGDFKAEGLVGEPVIPLFNRKGERIITKIKHCDFYE